jgi:DNA polymerase I-like protein with 3'-5' exonuclease and polymerase domains
MDQEFHSTTAWSRTSLLDWRAQEIGVAAAESGDQNMMNDYLSGDPYIAMGIRIGLLPPGSTRETGGHKRDMLKVVFLAVNYGMEAVSLAARLGLLPVQAQHILRQLHAHYRRFFEWSEGRLNQALALGMMFTEFGWRQLVKDSPDRKLNPRSLKNFYVQGNGAEIMRLAACYAGEQGVMINCTVHDAIMIEADASDIHHKTAVTIAAMARASREVLRGFELFVDPEIGKLRPITYPNRYVDERGVVMWNTVMSILDGLADSRGNSQEIGSEVEAEIQCK